MDTLVGCPHHDLTVVRFVGFPAKTPVHGTWEKGTLNKGVPTVNYSRTWVLRNLYLKQHLTEQAARLWALETCVDHPASQTTSEPERAHVPRPDHDAFPRRKREHSPSSDPPRKQTAEPLQRLGRFNLLFLVEHRPPP